MTTPPASDKAGPPAAEVPGVAGRTDAAPGWVRPSAAGKALARALSALAADAPAQKPARAVSHYGFACSGDQSANRRSGDGRIARCELTGCGGRRGAAHEGNRGGSAGHILVCHDAGPVESQSAQALAPEDANRPAVAADVANRAVQAAAPATKATVDIDVDANHK